MTVESKSQDEATDQELHEYEHEAERSDADGAVSSDLVLPKQQTHVDNKLFKDYYIMQGIVSVEELDKFIQHIKKPLPLTFRVTGDRNNVKDMLRIIKKDLIEEKNVPLVQLPWYPDDTVWQLNSEEIVADQIKALDDFNKFIYQQSACGNVSQVDAVNLIPGLLLDVKPHHKVLTVHAGTGETVSQLLDLLHCEGKSRDLDGFLIASETEYKQCRALVDHMPKLTSPNLAIVNLNDALLQDLHLPVGDSKTEVVRYDRILCHLPSSGDGMFRQNVDALRGWSAFMPFSYHGPLCQTLYSGLSQLAVGGRLIYYTDSMNPIENEAILYTVITQQRGSVELVDISSELPKILHEKGLDTWKVMAKGPRWFREHSEVPETLRDQIWETMFPPPTKEEAEQFHLERCIRILPHRQNTAGLFVAVLTRTETLEQCWKREQEQYQAWLKAEEEKAAAEKAAAEKAAAEKAAAEKAAAEKAAAAAEKAAVKEATVEKSVESTAEEKMESEKTAAEKLTDDKAETDKTDVDKSSAVPGDSDTSNEKAEKESQEVQMDVDTSDDNKAESKTEPATGTVIPGVNGTAAVEAVQSEKASEAGTHREESITSAVIPEMVHPYDNNMFFSSGHSQEISKEDSLAFLTETDPVWLRIQDFFGIAKNFPSTQLAVRSQDRSCVFYMSSSLKSLTLANQKRISFVHVGVKMFCRVSTTDCSCNYRLTQEGLPILYPYLQRRILLLPRQDFITMLTSHTTDVSALTKETQKKLGALDSGNVVFVCKEDNSTKGPSSRLMISGWKDDARCRSYLPSYQREYYLLACGSDLAPPEELLPAEAAKVALTTFVQAMTTPDRT